MMETININDTSRNTQKNEPYVAEALDGTIFREKPPIGAKPNFLAAGDRIKELSEAIARYPYDAKEYMELIEGWVEEIQMQLLIIKVVDLKQKPLRFDYGS